MAHVYILESQVDGRYYIGSTNNIEQRIRHHQSGGTPTTKRFGRVELVFKQEYSTLQDARRIERKLKKMKRKDYLRKIIKNKIITIT